MVNMIAVYKPFSPETERFTLSCRGTRDLPVQGGLTLTENDIKEKKRPRIGEYQKLRTVGERGLNTSPKLRAYIPLPSNPCFRGVLGCLFSREVSSLDAFSSYPLGRSCPACPVGQPVNKRPRNLVPLVLKVPSPQTSYNPSRY